MATKKRVNYIDNDVLFKELSAYVRAVQEAENQGEIEKPRISDALGRSIQLISNKLGTKGNFAGYSYIEEMIGDGVENCLRYCHNFNPDKYDNAHTYLTTIIWQAFVRRIEKEKKQAHVKVKVMENSLLFDILVEQSSENHLHFSGNSVSLNNDNMNYQSASTKAKKRAVGRPKKLVASKRRTTIDLTELEDV